MHNNLQSKSLSMNFHYSNCKLCLKLHWWMNFGKIHFHNSYHIGNLLLEPLLGRMMMNSNFPTTQLSIWCHCCKCKQMHFHSLPMLKSHHHSNRRNLNLRHLFQHELTSKPQSSTIVNVKISLNHSFIIPRLQLSSCWKRCLRFELRRLLWWWHFNIKKRWRGIYLHLQQWQQMLSWVVRWLLFIIILPNSGSRSRSLPM